jgi:hypothetical protein
MVSRGTLVGKRCSRGTGQNYSVTHYLYLKTAQFSPRVMVEQTILPGYFLTENAQPLNRKFYESIK